MLGEGDELLLTDSGEIGIARHEAADALVGVFHGTFLPRRTGVAEPAPRADALFQSPESGKLRAAIKGEAVDQPDSAANSVGTFQNLPGEPIEIIGMSHLEIECTNLLQKIA